MHFERNGFMHLGNAGAPQEGAFSWQGEFAKLLVCMMSFAVEEKSTHKPTLQAHCPQACVWEICETSHFYPACTCKVLKSNWSGFHPPRPSLKKKKTQKFKKISFSFFQQQHSTLRLRICKKQENLNFLKNQEFLHRLDS